MARKGNPISVRLDLNRSSDPSWFSEGDRENHRMGSVRLFLIFLC
nr:ribosomal protein S3 [Agrostis stolonifera]WGN99087.1 ribosomal protein S3 [Agrostis stolonifera]